MKLNDKQTNILFYSVLAVAGYFLVGKPILIKLGILKGKGEKFLEDPTSPLNPSFFQNKLYVPFINTYKSGMKIGTDALYKKIQIATAKIYGAIGGIFGDDEGTIFGAFQLLNTQAEVSAMSYYFLYKHGISLGEYLQGGSYHLPYAGLNEGEMQQLVAIINNKPVK